MLQGRPISPLSLPKMSRNADGFCIVFSVVWRLAMVLIKSEDGICSSSPVLCLAFPSSQSGSQPSARPSPSASPSCLALPPEPLLVYPAPFLSQCPLRPRWATGLVSSSSPFRYPPSLWRPSVGPSCKMRPTAGWTWRSLGVLCALQGRRLSCYPGGSTPTKSFSRCFECGGSILVDMMEYTGNTGCYSVIWLSSEPELLSFL